MEDLKWSIKKYVKKLESLRGALAWTLGRKRNGRLHCACLIYILALRDFMLPPVSFFNCGNDTRRSLFTRNGERFYGIQ